MVRWAVAVAVVALIAPLSACSLPSPGPATSTPVAEDAPTAAVQRYYDQTLIWKDCDDGAQCTTAIAPMDWDNPSTDTDISLALTRHVATGKKLGSLFVNPGGPGGSGYDFVHDDVDSAVQPALAKSYDVIGWDPRGVGRSSAVKCYDDAQLDDFLYDIPAAPVDTPEYDAETIQASKDFGAACLKNTGQLLNFVDTQSTVRDLDMLRAIVGDTALNYLGYSYGSDIGMYYADRFATKVGKMVLDGSTDSTVTSFDVTLAQTAGFELALRNYLTACPKTDDCPFTGNMTADLATIHGLYETLDAKPLTAPDGRKLTAGVLDTAMSMALYDESSWPYLSDLFSEVEAGTTTTAFYLSDFYYGRDTDGTYADNSTEAFVAISCLDYPAVTDPAEIARENAELLKASPTTAQTSDLGDVTCANWPFQHRGGAAKVVTGAGAAPILIVSTTGDPATPYQWGVALSHQLQSAHLVTNNGEGHTGYNGDSRCVNTTVDNYFTKGTVPDADPKCAT
ncbi:alpha/beta hydrolase [Glaciihabitans sp. dw_435]|uniref:alpha/beta hydrolase n=1 Tax=Glaciihabitans sp. dw_435 TaxID=2720081 RepID=UPI0027DE17CB|nr:alpha/beta hydrolase [Glaciihabitans sp. dw_435]